MGVFYKNKNILCALNDFDKDGFSKIITLLDQKIKQSHVMREFEESEEKILIDCAIASGLSKYRFIKLEKGEWEYVELSPEATESANEIIGKYPSYLRNSLIFSERELKELIGA